MKKPLGGLTALALLTTLPQGAYAGGFALIENSASGMGNAFAGAAAIAEDASTVWFNPAGMTKLDGAQISAAIHYISPTAKFTNDGTSSSPFGPLSGANDASSESAFIPNFYYVRPLDDTLYFGLGVNVPFGMETSYDEGWVGRYHGTDSMLRVININPSLARKFADKVSVGFGMNLQYAEADLGNMIDSGGACADIGNDVFNRTGDNTLLNTCMTNIALDNFTDSKVNFKGKNWSMGFNVGLLFELSENTRLGLAYRSEVKQDLKGDANFNLDPTFGTILSSAGIPLMVDSGVSAVANLPASTSLSLTTDVNDRLTLLADITWTGWHSFDELRVVFDNPLQPDSVTDESWENTMRYAIGANYRINDKWLVRAGAAYDETPIPNAQHRTPRIPGNDRTWVSLGAGYKVDERMSIDVGYAHLFIQNSNSDFTDDNGYSLIGEYEGDADIFSVQGNWKF